MAQETLLVIRGGIILCDQLCLWIPYEETALAPVDVISDILIWCTEVCSSFIVGLLDKFVLVVPPVCIFSDTSTRVYPKYFGVTL
jgi:hypothetical protein